MRIIFSSCMVVRVFASVKKPQRQYVDLLDLESGNKFEFSTETMPPSDLHKITRVQGAFDGIFETYTFSKDGGSPQLMFKCMQGTFAPAVSAVPALAEAVGDMSPPKK